MSRRRIYYVLDEHAKMRQIDLEDIINDEFTYGDMEIIKCNGCLSYIPYRSSDIFTEDHYGVSMKFINCPKCNYKILVYNNTAHKGIDINE